MASEKESAAQDIAKEAAKKAAMMAAKSAATQAATWLSGIVGASLLPIIGIFLISLFAAIATIAVIYVQCEDSTMFKAFSKVIGWGTWSTPICDMLKLK